MTMTARRTSTSILAATIMTMMTRMSITAITIMTTMKTMMSMSITAAITTTMTMRMTTTSTTAAITTIIEVFQSWGVETPKKFNEEEIRNALAALDNGETYGIVLRAKGIVPTADGTWLHFDHVPGEIDVRTGTAAVTGRLCVIGSKLDEKALAALFGV